MMWNKFSLKIQLMFFMTVLVIVIELATLFVMQDLYKKNRMEFAIGNVEILSKSLNNDLLKALLTQNIDTFSDITFRLSAFKNLKDLIVFDKEENPIFHYKNSQLLALKDSIIKDKIIFTDNDLFIKSDIIDENYTFGYALIDIDLSEHKAQQKKDMLKILLIFPFALLLGFIISLIFSKSYTKPFSQLLSAMRKSDPANNKIITLKTQAKNEIKELFDGFNQSMTQIESSAKMYIYQAEHDQLTNLYNRFFIEKEIQNALKNEKYSSNALIVIDLTQFKLINDTVGYQAGDELLKMIAAQTQELLPPNAIMARTDGANFLILVKNITKEDAVLFVNKYLCGLNDFRFSKDGQALSVTASMGLVAFKPFEYTQKELMKAANTAIYSAKVAGRNKLHIFNPQDDISQRFDQEIKVAGFIKEALKKGSSRFELYAQAIVPLQYKTDKISYEILIRMWDNEKNFVSPMDFLPTAERYQLMAEIDMFVLWEYLESVASHPNHIEKLHSVHINLAGSTLNNSDFQAKLKQAITHFSFPWKKLELEVTETSAIGNFNTAKDFIGWMKHVGIGLALDDFGTGMSSFEYLKSLPFDVVKIDGSFVKDMHTDLSDRAVIKYIQEIASLKGQETVAEYVETQEDVDELTKIGITYGQGYYLGKPKPLSQWLEISQK